MNTIPRCPPSKRVKTFLASTVKSGAVGQALFSNLAPHRWPNARCRLLYASFVALGTTGIPKTYAEWIAQQRQANFERDRVDERPVPVPIRLHEFKAFCDNRRMGYVGQWLLHYAMEKGAPRHVYA